MSYSSPYTFEKQDDFLRLSYDTERNWINEKLNTESTITLKRVFVFSKADIIEVQDEDVDDIFDEDYYHYMFKVGVLEAEYYRIDCIQTLTHNLYIHKDMDMSMKTFLHAGKVSIFEIIDKMIDHDIYVGGQNENAFSPTDFDTLIKQFPTEYEINKYRTARVSAIIKEAVELKKDYQADYEKYLNKKSSLKPPKFINDLRNSEIEKYTLIKRKLESMLQNETISEKQWQQEILEFILLLFPKYIKVIRELPIKDSFSNSMRSVDFALIDSSGYLDIIEIKKPDVQSIVSQRTYRDNHIPIKDLSGAIMQVEKYVLNLNKWGQHGEDYLNKKYKSDLPENFDLKIINPSGLIIMGRTQNLTTSQLSDFEVVKRKYKNVIDIITYDDLLFRLNTILSQFSATNFFTDKTQ
mgnify:CR=1 FL=1